MTVGEKIKQARKKAGLTQKKLGEKLGVSAAMVAQYEKGVRNPKWETLRSIATALNVETSSLLGDWDNYSPSEMARTMSETLTTMAESSNQAISESMNEAINAMSAMAKDEKELLSDYRNLNSYGKEEARKRVNELTEIPKYQKKDEQ